jgi:hypothetical protein
MGTFSVETLPHNGSTAPAAGSEKRGQSYNYGVVSPLDFDHLSLDGESEKTHNPLVEGSSPSRPTNFIEIIALWH